MLRKNLLITTIIVLLLSLLPTSVFAKTNDTTTPYAPRDCGVWAYDPAKSGSNVNGKAEVSCASNHASLRVVAGLRDSAGRYISKSKTCYNTNYCSITATLTYVANRDWQTDVSGYVTDISWSAYYATSWKHIP